MEVEERIEIIRRLRSAGGHLEAIINMVETTEPCESILHQLGAVQAALRAAGARVLACQLKQSLEILRCNPCPADQVVEVTRLLTLFELISKFSAYNES